MSALPSDDDKEDLLLDCRYNGLGGIQQFAETFGTEQLSQVRDEHGNSVLHMAAGNGHIEVVDYLLPLVSPSLLAVQNHSGSTPLHWAALNGHLPVLQALVQFHGGPGVALIDMKNTAGRSPLGEAEAAGWEEGAKWLVEMMRVDPGDNVKEEEGDGDESTPARDL